MNVHEMFKLGMDRDIPYPLTMQTPQPADEAQYVLNLGAGRKHIPGAVSLDLPAWNADEEPIPFGDETVVGIHAYHFLEHVEYPIGVLRECQRVMAQGAVMNIVVPYYSAAMAHHDLTHRHTFTEDTWRNLFNQPYYDRGKWEFRIHMNVIMGIVERNLALLTQLVKR